MQPTTQGSMAGETAITTRIWPALSPPCEHLCDSLTRREKQSLVMCYGRMTGTWWHGMQGERWLQRDMGATHQNSSCLPGDDQGTGLLTRQSGTRHPKGWTANPRVSAGRWQCPKAREEEKLCPLHSPHQRISARGHFPTSETQ